MLSTIEKQMLNQTFNSVSGELNDHLKILLSEFINQDCKKLTGISPCYHLVNPSHSIESFKGLNEWKTQNEWGDSMPILKNGETLSIYGGKVNELVRYWHDVNHITKQFNFSLQGETNTAIAQYKAMIDYGLPDALCKAVYADFYGQAAWYGRTKKFINNGIAFVHAGMVDLNNAINNYVDV